MTYKVQNNTVIDDNKNIISNSISHTMSTVSPSSGTLSLDLAQGAYFKIDGLVGNITSINVTNTPATFAFLFVLEIVYSSSDAISIVWPPAFKWSDSLAPILVPAAGKKDVFVFFSTDGGTTWNSFISGQNL